MAGEPVFLDTNVLVSASVEAHPAHVQANGQDFGAFAADIVVEKPDPAVID